jgi:PAS domain S-box-containing protein
MNHKTTVNDPIAEASFITADRSPAEVLLTASEHRYRRLFETAKDGILILDAVTGMVVDVNPFLIKLLGYSYEAFLGKAVWDLGFFRDIVDNEENFRELQQKEYIRYDDKPLKTADGRKIYVEFISNVYLVDHQKVIQCNIRDISDRKRGEAYREMGREILRLLNESENSKESLQQVLATLKTMTGFDAVGIRLQDGDDFPYYSQEGFSKEFLQTENSLIAYGADGGVCRDNNGNISLECTCGLVISGKTDPVNSLFTPGGSFWTNDSFPLLEIPVDQDPRLHPRNQCIHQGYTSVALIPIRKRGKIVGLIHLNDRRKGCFTLETVELLEGIASHIGAALMRWRIEESNARLATAVEQAAETIVITDTQGTILYANPAFEITTGYTCKEALGQNPSILKSGKQDAAFYREMWAMLNNGKVWTGHFFNKRKDGSFYEEEASISPVRDGAGTVVNYVAVKRDVTREVQLETQLRQAQKLEAVGRLAGGVAHDFNNLLMGIMGNVELCQDQIVTGHPSRESLDEIMTIAQRSAKITQQLLAFARKQTITPKILDLNDALAGMLKLLRQLMGEDIDLTWRPGADLHLVKIDPSQIDQILANLCINARDAIAGIGTITLETENTVIDAGYCANHPEASPGAYVLLAVSDDGCGMDHDTLTHIFEPFFTTKDVGNGTGLGLATVFGIVKQNGGFVYVYSEPNKGTTFKIYLPQVAAEAIPAPVPNNADAPRGRGETILLVEDEKSLRVTCSRFLDTLGYKVLLAENPKEALKIASQHSGPIHLLLTDVVMPGMDGLQLSKQLRPLHRGMKILFMSGYTAEVMAQRCEIEERMAFIAKPFSRNDLAPKLREVLDSKTETIQL